MEAETTTKDHPTDAETSSRPPAGAVLNDGQQQEGQATAGDNKTTEDEEDFQDALAERQEELTSELSQQLSDTKETDGGEEAAANSTQPPNGETVKALDKDSETEEEDFATALPMTQPFHDPTMTIDESTVERKQSVNAAAEKAQEKQVEESDKSAPEANPDPLKPDDLDKNESESAPAAAAAADADKTSLPNETAADDQKQPAKDDAPKKDSPREESNDKAGSWTSNMESNASELMEAAEQSKRDETKKPSRPEPRGKKMAVPAKKKRSVKLMAAKSVLSTNPDVTQSPEFRHYLESKGKESSTSVKEFIEFRNEKTRIEVPQGEEESEPKKPAAKPSGVKRPPVQASTTKPAKKAKKQKAPRADTLEAAALAGDQGRKAAATEIWSGPPDEPLEGGWPVGWTKKVFERATGATKGRPDRYWYSPKLGKKFRSMTEVKRFMEALRTTGNDEDRAWKKFKSK